MRVRLLVTAAAAAVLAATIPAHAAKTPVLDGKKVKTLTFTATATPQTNDADIVTDQAAAGPLPVRPDDYMHCPTARCFTWKFVYNPAKGVKSGPISVKLSWTYPVEDFDLYTFDSKYGDTGYCAASAGTSETVVIDPPVRGHTYLIVIDEYRAIPDTVKVSVKFPAETFTSQVPGGGPGDAAGFNVDCGLNK